MNGRYKLIGHTPVEVDDLMEWADEVENTNHCVQRDEIDGVTVSTVFLTLDHSFGQGSPLLFETMIFGGFHDGYQERYTTWDEAVEGHQKALGLVKSVISLSCEEQ